MDYLLIFDTNALYKDYTRCCDFTDFSFNGTLDNFMTRIEELDIYDIVSIAIPQIVWSETKKQNIIAYHKKVKEFEDTLKKHKLPFHSYKIDTTKNYDTYLDENMNAYKNALKNKPINIVELNFPSDKCYFNLINRAFDKRPPFEGKENNSDKGFKDALLWESILEYKKEHHDTNIILYTNDKMFNDELKEEYKKLFSNQEIIFINSKNEDILNSKLDQIAKDKDNTYPIPPKYPEEHSELKEYLNSDNILNDLRSFSNEIIGDTKYLSLNKFIVKNIYNIEQLHEDEIFSGYEVMIRAEIIVDTNSASSFTDELDMTLWINSCDDYSFVVEEIRIDDKNLEVADE